MPYLDLNHSFNNNMPVFPGDGATELIQVSDVSKDGIANHLLKTSMHVGTHMDGPAHMLLGGKPLSEYPAEKFFGRGVIIDARGKSAADAELLSSVQIQKGDVVLVCFSWSTEFFEEDYYLNYPEISESFAVRLVELGASIIGMDTPSPDRAPYSAHKILLNGDILIIENLTNLEQLIGQKNFEIIALPMKLETDSAPCRVVAKII